MDTVYLLHFTERYRHARHYLGSTNDLPKRLLQENYPPPKKQPKPKQKKRHPSLPKNREVNRQKKTPLTSLGTKGEKKLTGTIHPRWKETVRIETKPPPTKNTPERPNIQL